MTIRTVYQNSTSNWFNCQIATGVSLNHLEQTHLSNLLIRIDRVTKSEDSEIGPNHHQTNQKTKVTNTVHDKRFVGRVTGRLALGIKSNQQKAANTDKLPKHKHLKNVTRQHQAEHGKAKQGQKRKKPVEASRTMNMMPIGKMSMMIHIFFR